MKDLIEVIGDFMAIGISLLMVLLTVFVPIILILALGIFAVTWAVTLAINAGLGL